MLANFFKSAIFFYRKRERDRFEQHLSIECEYKSKYLCSEKNTPFQQANTSSHATNTPYQMQKTPTKFALPKKKYAKQKNNEKMQTLNTKNMLAYKKTNMKYV